MMEFMIIFGAVLACASLIPVVLSLVFITVDYLDNFVNVLLGLAVIVFASGAISVLIGTIMWLWIYL